MPDSKFWNEIQHQVFRDLLRVTFKEDDDKILDTKNLEEGTRQYNEEDKNKESIFKSSIETNTDKLKKEKTIEPNITENLQERHYEKKYEILYSEYCNMHKECDELKRFIEELKMEQKLKEINFQEIMNYETYTKGIQLSQLFMIAIISLILGIIIAKII